LFNLAKFKVPWDNIICTALVLLVVTGRGWVLMVISTIIDDHFHNSLVDIVERNGSVG
jgi:hypothetical protein